MRCHEKKPREQFPMGRSGKRRSAVCWTCTEAAAYDRERRKEAKRATWVEMRPWGMALGWLAGEGGETVPVVVRRCFVCHEVKVLRLGFYRTQYAGPKSRWPKNGPCKPCADRRIKEQASKNAKRKHERMRAAGKRYAERHPDRVKARNARRWKRIKADPARHARELEDQRINRRLRNERAGRKTRKVTPRITQPTGRSFVPAAPLIALIERRLDAQRRFDQLFAVEANTKSRVNVDELCRELGTDERTLNRWRSGEQSKVRVGNAERILLNAHVSWRDIFSEDYAEVFEP